MRKLLLSSLVLAMVAAPMAAKAQVASGTIAVTADVPAWGSVSLGRDLAMGTLTQGAGKTVAATDDANNGYVHIQYNFAAKVSASITTQLTGPTTLPMTLLCAQSPTNAAGSYTAVAGCTFTDRTAPSSLALGSYYLGFGGTITQANIDVAPAGSYNGTITIQLAQ